jgi:hypothetical protein
MPKRVFDTREGETHIRSKILPLTLTLSPLGRGEGIRLISQQQKSQCRFLPSMA